MLYINLKIWLSQGVYRHRYIKGVLIQLFFTDGIHIPIPHINCVNVKELLIEVEGPEVGSPRLPALLLYQPDCVSA